MIVPRINKPLVGNDESHRVEQEARKGGQAVQSKPFRILFSVGDHVYTDAKLNLVCEALNGLAIMLCNLHFVDHVMGSGQLDSEYDTEDTSGYMKNLKKYDC